MRCPKCGSKLKDNEKYCVDCGTKIEYKELSPKDKKRVKISLILSLILMYVPVIILFVLEYLFPNSKTALVYSGDIFLLSPATTLAGIGLIINAGELDKWKLKYKILLAIYIIQFILIGFEFLSGLKGCY